MQEVKIYTASPSDLSPPVQSESFCVDMVLASDYAELEEKCAALAAENELARKAVQAFCDVVGDNTEVISEEVGRDGVLVILEAMKATGNMPATDAFLAEVRASARNEGINYAASRLAAAFNHGFLDKPVSEVLDVTRMILSAKEDLSNDPLPADDGLSGEYAEKSIEEWAAQLRKGVQS
ncbi:hypothetical protein PK12_003592 [Salmonella enterica subsp. enterica]|nr:hypothetical protein [Salmonella enterica]EDQ2492960.1 hypothetical protein [Salmonella enterica subsp. enterica serovar Bonariensis]EDX8941624.1 hypothetical protein [Salmonella enterica subsp. enterica serovar Aba]ECT6519071.1 hypothetical protein [Salmonella enterica]EDV0207830.1 hypothetical protein [Salmonella enterica subsp. enterica serovar Bonariensis]